LRSVPAKMLSGLRDRRTSTASAWEAIKRICVGVQRVREANTHQLRRDFGALVWKEAENAKDFTNRIIGLAADLHLLGDNIKNVEVVRKMLQVVPEHLSQVVISIETLLDINTISVEEVTGMLRVVEQQRKPVPILDNQGRLLLCEEKWMTKLKICEAKGKGGASGSNGGNNKKHGTRGRGRECRNGDNSASSSRDGKRSTLLVGREPRRTNASAMANMAIGPGIAAANRRPRPTSCRPRKRMNRPC
jgi:hypothetical protein